MRWAAVLLSALLLVCVDVGAQADETGTASVIDGDTLDIHGSRFRLHGIDAPESSQICEKHGAKYLCGKESANALADKIRQETVTCATKDQDRYGRDVAVCSLGKIDLNAWMVVNGYAVAYRKYSTDYVEFEDVARRAGLGLWAGTFEMPWDYRKNRRGETISGPQSFAEPVADGVPCCKACKTGQPCGASCISRDKVCHKPCKPCG